ncbi:MAG TPA: O-antigen ligase family protein [Polyangiaceae bacterium]|nr:O-antigen ligase family protein [Polyangiaceae bacterium]
MEQEKDSSAAAQEAATSQGRSTRWLLIITLIGVYGGLLMPLVYARVVVFPFVYLKLLYFQIVVGLSFPAWFALGLRDARYRPRRSTLLVSLLAWFAAMGLSTLFAENRWHSFFGTQERMTGLFSLLHFFAWYLMASTTLRSSRDFRRLLEFQVGVGFVAAVAVLLQAVFPSLIGSIEAAKGERLSGLLGNPIFLAAYQVFNLFCVLFLWEGASARRRCLYGVAVLAALGAFALAGSRGPLLGLGVGVCACILTLAWTGQRRRLVASAALAIGSLFACYALFVAFIAHRPALDSFWSAHRNLEHLFDFQVDAVRIRLWSMAWSGFTHRPIFGFGPVGYEAASEVLYRPELYTLHVFDEVHNCALAVLCETGIVGFAAFLALWGAYGVTVVRALQRKVLAPLPGASLLGAGVAHFTQSLFAFDTPATQLSVFILFAVASAALASSEPAREPGVPSAAPAFVVARFAVPAVMAAVVLTGSVLPGLASWYVKQASVAQKERQLDAMLALLQSAQQIPTPYVDDQLMLASRAMLQITKAKKLDDWSESKAAVTLTRAIGDSYLAHHAAYGRLRGLYASVLLAMAKTSVGAELLPVAEAQYQKNLADSPENQRYLIDYAKFCVETGRLAQAEQLFRKAVALHPPAGGPRWELGKFIWNQLKRPEEGATMMADATGGLDGFSPVSPPDFQQLAQVYWKAGRVEQLRSLVPAVAAFPPVNRETDAHLAIAGYMEKSELLSERDQVLRLALAQNPALAPAVNPVLAGTAKLSEQRRSPRLARQ